jgi:hypothetical protein
VSTRRFKVVCTRRNRRTKVSQHGRIDFPDLILHDDGSITEATTRTGRSPLSGPIQTTTDDGVVAGEWLPGKAILKAASHKQEHGTWRWKCSCGLDVPVTEANLRLWMRDTPTGVFDISLVQ